MTSETALSILTRLGNLETLGKIFLKRIIMNGENMIFIRHISDNLPVNPKEWVIYKTKNKTTNMVRTHLPMMAYSLNWRKFDREPCNIIEEYAIVAKPKNNYNSPLWSSLELIKVSKIKEASLSKNSVNL
jgi:hypothetical protein